MSNRIVGILLGGTVFFGIVMAVMIGFTQQSLNDSPFNKQVFDEKLWKTYKQSIDRDNPRGMMANDVKRRLFENPISKKGVITMLGEPDDAGENFVSYNLGMWSNNRNQRDAMVIYFNESGGISELRFAKQ